MEAGRVARVLLLKLFYDDTPNGVLGMLLRLVREYDKTWQPRRWVQVARFCCALGVPVTVPPGLPGLVALH